MNTRTLYEILPLCIGGNNYKKRILLVLLIIVILIIVTACMKEIAQNQVEIEWVDFIKFDDITYYSNDYLTDYERDNIKLGEVYDTVKFKVADVVFDPN